MNLTSTILKLRTEQTKKVELDLAIETIEKLKNNFSPFTLSEVIETLASDFILSKETQSVDKENVKEIPKKKESVVSHMEITKDFDPTKMVSTNKKYGMIDEWKRFIETKEGIAITEKLLERCSHKVQIEWFNKYDGAFLVKHLKYIHKALDEGIIKPTKNKGNFSQIFTNYLRRTKEDEESRNRLNSTLNHSMFSPRQRLEIPKNYKSKAYNRAS